MSPGDGGQVRVMVVDDHPMWRDAVARDLEEAGFAVVGTAADGAAAVRIASAVRPDVVVMDLQLPELSGVGATEQIIGALPQTRVLVLSASGEQADVLEAVKAGATGYLVKSASVSELVEAVGRTAAGDATFTPGLAGLLLGEYRRLTTGGPEPQAGPQLTDRTVQNHVQNAMSKLHVHNRAGLVRYAIEAGLDAPEDA